VKQNSSTIALYATIAAMLAVGGCAVGPDYKPPTPVAGAEVPLVSTTPTAETVAEPPDDWWQLYHDETLDGLLQEAFTANTDIRVAAANLTSSRAVLSAVKSQRFPQTQADLAARLTSMPGDRGDQPQHRRVERVCLAHGGHYHAGLFEVTACGVQLDQFHADLDLEL